MTKEKTNIKLTFIVYGEMFDIEQLTRIIGVTPTDQAYKGDQLKYRISEETFWEYKFAPIETLLIEDCLAEFEQMVKPVLKELSALSKLINLPLNYGFV